MKEIMPLENINAITVFKEGGLDDLLIQIKKEACSHVPDLTSERGRKAIASVAYKVSKSKVYLDDLGKNLTTDLKAQANLIDDERKKARDQLDGLRDEIRKPLDDWEQAEQDRVDNIMQTITETINAGNDAVVNHLSQDLQSMKDRLEEIESIDPEEGYDEYSERMAEVRLVAITKMNEAITRREKHDADQLELEELRKKQEERERKDAEEVAAKAQKEREAEIAKNAEAKAHAEKVKAIQEKQEAEQRAIEAEEKAKREIEKAEKEARDKLAREKQAEKEEQEKRERNTRHKAKINNESVNALMKLKLTDVQAKKIVTAIAKGKIPNIAISY